MKAVLPSLGQPQTNVDWITYKTAIDEIPDGPVLTNDNDLLYYQKEKDLFFCLVHRDQLVTGVDRSTIVRKAIARYEPNGLDITLRFNYVNHEGKFSRRHVVPLLFYYTTELFPVHLYPPGTRLLVAWDLDKHALRFFDFEKATNIFSTFWGVAGIKHLFDILGRC